LLLSRLALFALLTCDVDTSSVEAGLVKELDWLAAIETDALPASVLTDPSSRSDDATGFSFDFPLDAMVASFSTPLDSSFNHFFPTLLYLLSYPFNLHEIRARLQQGRLRARRKGGLIKKISSTELAALCILCKEKLMVIESPADFAERTAIRISQSFEEFEDTLAATEGRHPSPDLSVVQQADELLKSLNLSTDYEQASRRSLQMCLLLSKRH